MSFAALCSAMLIIIVFNCVAPLTSSTETDLYASSHGINKRHLQLYLLQYDEYDGLEDVEGDLEEYDEFDNRELSGGCITITESLGFDTDFGNAACPLIYNKPPQEAAICYFDKRTSNEFGLHDEGKDCYEPNENMNHVKNRSITNRLSVQFAGAASMILYHGPCHTWLLYDRLSHELTGINVLIHYKKSAKSLGSMNSADRFVIEYQLYERFNHEWTSITDVAVLMFILSALLVVKLAVAVTARFVNDEQQEKYNDTIQAVNDHDYLQVCVP